MRSLGLPKNLEFFKNAGVLFAGNLLTQALSAVIYIICARGMLPNEYGRAVACAGVVILANTAVDFGGSTFAIREFASGRMTGPTFKAWSTSKILVVFCAAPVAGLIGALVSGSFNLVTVLLASALFVGSSVAIIAVVPLRAQMRFNLVMISLIGSRVAPAVAAILIYSTDLMGPSTLLLLLAAAPIIESVSYYVAMRLRVDTGGSAGRFHFANPYKSGTGVGASSVASTVGSLDISVVRAVGGGQAAGEYAAVNRWMTPIGLVAQVTTQALFPRMSSVHPTNRFSILKSALGMVSLSLPILAVVAFLASPLVRLLLGPAYVGAGGTLAVLCLAIAFSVGTQPISSALVAWRMEGTSAAVVGASALLQLGCQGYLAARLGAIGAAWGACIGQAVTLGLLVGAVYVSRKRWSNPAVLDLRDDKISTEACA